MADFTSLVPPKFTRTTADYATHMLYLQELGVDPKGRDDKVFGTEFVYCGYHLRAHNAGRCIVRNINKVPLSSTDAIGAANEARQLGFKLYDDMPGDPTHNYTHLYTVIHSQ